MVEKPDSHLEDMTIPPWNYEQVDALNRFQFRGFMHPFTCANEHPGDKTLVAIRSGWICPHCEYTQFWAHKFMMLEPVDPFAAYRTEGREG